MSSLVPASQPSSNQQSRMQRQAEQDRRNQEANRAFLEATARGGDVKSIKALEAQGVPVVTTSEGPYRRTYVGEQQVSEGIQRVQSGIYTDSSGQLQSNYGIDENRSPYLIKTGDAYYVNPKHLSEIQNQQIQAESQRALSQEIGPRARLELGPNGKVLSSYSERITNQGILGEERKTTTQKQELADILAAPEGSTFEIEIGGVKKSGVSKRDILNEYFAFQEKEKATESSIRTSLLDLKEKGTTHVYITEGGKRKLTNIDEAIAKDYDFSAGVTIEPRMTAKERALGIKQERELDQFIGSAKQSGAERIFITGESGSIRAVPIESAKQEIKKEKGQFTLSLGETESYDLNTLMYSERVDRGIAPKPKTLPEQFQYYGEVATRPIGDIFFPASSAITGKELKYTPSTGGKAIDALITSTKYSFGFGEKDQSGKPIDQSFGATFGPIAKDIMQDPIKTAVQVPAEIGLGIIGGGAVKAGTILTKKGIIQPVATKLAQREITTTLTKTFTGEAPRRTISTKFGEPLTQKSITRQGQEIATDVIIPIKRTVDRPAIIVERVPGRQDLFKVEGGKIAETLGGSTKEATKDLYIQKAGKDLIPIVVEQPIKETPQRVLVRGQIGFTEKETLKAMEKSGLNVKLGQSITGKQGEMFTTEGKPSKELLQILATQIIKPSATVSQFTFKQVAENPRQYARYFFGSDSREQLQMTLRNLEKPVSGKPIRDVLVADTRSFGTVGSKIGTSPQKLVSTGKKTLVSGLEWTEKITNPVKSNIPGISNRIQRGFKELSTIGRADKRVREIEERNISGLEKRKIQIAEQPAEIERKVRGLGEREILKAPKESTGFRLGFGKRALGSRRPEIFKAFGKRSRPTDSYVADVERIGGSFKETSRTASKTGRPFSFPQETTKGIAGSSGKSKALQLTKSESQGVVSSITSPPKVRMDAFGEITDPIYLRAYPALEFGSASALEPKTLSSRRPTFDRITSDIARTESGLDVGIIGLRTTSQTFRTGNILLQRPTTKTGLQNLEKISTGEILRTRQTTIPILTPRITTEIIPRLTTRQETLELQTFRGFGVGRLTSPGFPGGPFKPSTFESFIFNPLPKGGGFGGGGGFLGGGGRKGGGTGLFKTSVYNPLAPSLSIRTGKRGKKRNRGFIF